MNTTEALILVAGAAAVALYIKKQLPAVADAARAAANAVNPLNKENVFYTGTNAAGAAVTGNSDFNLGASVWELFNSGAVAKERAAFAPTTAPAPSVASLTAWDRDDADIGYWGRINQIPL